MRYLFSILFIVAANAYCQTPDQFSANAAIFSERGATPVSVVRESAAKNSWVKIQANIVKASWEVKKTDSPSQPMIGIAWIDLKAGVSKRFPTKEGAESASSIEFDTESVELTFVPSSNGWVFDKGQHTDKLFGTNPIKLPRGNAFTPHGWLVNGFSVPELATPGL